MENLKLISLKEHAKSLGLKNYSKLKKEDLINLINSVNNLKPIVEAVVKPVVESKNDNVNLIECSYNITPVKLTKTKKTKPDVEPEIIFEKGPITIDFNNDVKKGRKLKKEINK